MSDTVPTGGSVAADTAVQNQSVRHEHAGGRAKQLAYVDTEGNGVQVTQVEIPAARLEVMAERLRVCLLSQAYPPEKFDGVGRSTQLLARGLAELGHDVHVITHGQAEQTVAWEGTKVHKIVLSLNRYARYRHLPATHSTLNYSHAVYEKVRKLQRRHGIQLVDSPLWQVEGLVTEKSGLLPVVVRPVTAIRQIAELQNNRDPDRRMLGDMEQVLLERAAFLAANSKATVKALSNIYQIPLSVPHEVLPYGIAPVPDDAVRLYDRRRIYPGATDNATASATGRTVDGAAEGANRPLDVLFLGRMEKRKGILDLFAAIPQVVAVAPYVRFTVAGADNSLADGFQSRTGHTYGAWFARQHPDMAPYIRFLGGVSDEQLNQLYQSCDLFVAPSLYESFGLIYLEAMNYGKPVVGCLAGGIPEVVDNGVNGILVEPEAPQALAEAILRLVRSPALLYEMGLAGRQRLLDRFTYLHMARSFTAAYATVLQPMERQAII